MGRTALFSRKHPGGVFTIQDVTQHPGNIWYVDSGQTTTGADAAGYGQNPDAPFLTIDYAVGQCEASNGDVIYVMPGHAETQASAAALVDADVEGISIIGLGNGDDRPTLTFSHANADLDIDADNITIENIRFIGGVASLAAPIDVNKAYFTMRNCEFKSSAAGYGVQISIITDANCNDITVEDCTFQYLVATDGTTAITQTSTEAIRLVGADRAVIKGCYFSGDFTTSAINCVTTASKDIKILNNHIYNIATENIAGAIDLAANTTGFLDGNICHVTYVTSAAALIDDASCVLGLNYVNNATSEAPALHGSAETIGVEAQVAVIDGYMDVPTARSNSNAQMRDVIGNKTDTRADGAAVSSTASLSSYVKQLVADLIIADAAVDVIDGYQDVPTARSNSNAQMRDVIGNKTDTRADGAAVGSTASLTSYAKQLVSDLIITDAAVDVIDGYMDVPTARSNTNAQMRDVIGNKTDTRADGAAVGTTASLTSYVKQLVSDLIIVDGYHDVATANAATNAVMSDVIGNKTDNQRDGVVGSTASLTSYVKQLVATNDSMHVDGANYFTVTAVGTSATWNSVATHEIATVTGMVRMRILPVISTDLTGAGADICLGTSADTAVFIAATSATDLDDREIWWTSTAASNVSSVRLEHIEDQIVNEDDVGYEVAVAAFGAGSIIFHIWWEALNATGAVVAGVGGTLT